MSGRTYESPAAITLALPALGDVVYFASFYSAPLEPAIAIGIHPGGLLDLSILGYVGVFTTGIPHETMSKNANAGRWLARSETSTCQDCGLLPTLGKYCFDCSIARSERWVAETNAKIAASKAARGEVP